MRRRSPTVSPDRRGVAAWRSVLCVVLVRTRWRRADSQSCSVSYMYKGARQSQRRAERNRLHGFQLEPGRKKMSFTVHTPLACTAVSAFSVFLSHSSLRSQSHKRNSGTGGIYKGGGPAHVVDFNVRHPLQTRFGISCVPWAGAANIVDRKQLICGEGELRSRFSA